MLAGRHVNSAASRAYYAMFQAAQIALEYIGSGRAMWSHAGLQAAFATECIHRRKVYPAALREHLSIGLRIRQVADYGHTGVSLKTQHIACSRERRYLCLPLRR